MSQQTLPALRPSLVSREKFEEAIQLLKENYKKPVIVDCETNKAKWRQERYLMGIGICIFEGREEPYLIYFPIGHKEWDTEMFPDGNIPEEWHDELRSALQGVIPVAHHMRFDQEVTEDWGIHFEHTFKYHYIDKDFEAPAWYDTLIMSHVENENKHSHELDVLSANTPAPKFKKSIDTIADGLGGWERIPPEVMARYCTRDCLAEFYLFKKYWASIERQSEDLFNLLPRENRITQIIQKLENRGVGLDIERAKQLSDSAEKEIRQILDELGFDPAKPSQLAHRLYALPPEGLGFRPEAYSKRKSKEFSPGIPNMDDAILSRLVHPEIEKIRRFRTLQKANSTWYGPFQKAISPFDGRMHSTYKQHGTVTTRWTSSKPNLNQLPRDVKKTPVRKLLMPRPGYELWELDISQQEMRFITIYAEVQGLAEAYKRGDDVHAITAQRIGAYEKFPDDPELARYVGKQANLGLQYMAGPDVLGDQIYGNSGIQFSKKDLKEFHGGYHQTYPEIKRFNNKAKQVAEVQGFIELWNKRRRHLSEWDAKKAGNSLIQGGCAQMVYDLMIMLDDLGYYMVGQVYDSVWIEVEEGDTESVPVAQKMMEEWIENYFEFPFPVDAKRLN